MSRAIKAILDDPYFHTKFTATQQKQLREWFNLGLDKPH